MAAKKESTSQTFENAIERLEAVVEQMESDSLPLEDLLSRYEEGLKLVKFCSEKLDSAEKRIEIIARDASGKAKLVEFDTAKSPPPAAATESSPAPAGAEVDSEMDESVRLF